MNSRDSVSLYVEGVMGRKKREGRGGAMWAGTWHVHALVDVWSLENDYQ